MRARHADFELEFDFELTGRCDDGHPTSLSMTLAESLDLEGFDVVSEGSFVEGGTRRASLIGTQVNTFLFLAAINSDTSTGEFLASIEFSIVALGYGDGTSSGATNKAHTRTAHSGEILSLDSHLFIEIATAKRIHRVPVVSLGASLAIVTLEEDGSAKRLRFVWSH